MSNISKYSREDKKHIVDTIENLKNDKDYIKIFEILTEDKNNLYTQNSNGVFLNLSIVSDNSLDKVIKYLNKINKRKINLIDTDPKIIPKIIDENKNNRMYKLSNYEKNILKQRDLKKVMNNHNEYEEFKFYEKKINKKKINTKKK